MTIPGNSASAGMGAPSGDQPQQGVPNTPSTHQGVPAQPVPGSSAQEPTAPSQQSVANPEAQRYAQEAARERQRASAAEARVKELETAQLTDLEKAQRKAQELELQNSEKAVHLQAERLENAINRARSDAGINPAVPADDLAALLMSRNSVTFDRDDRPQDVAKALKELVKDKPYLAGSGSAQAAASTQQQQPPAAQSNGMPAAASSGGPVNPGRGATPGGWNWELISGMTPQQYNSLSDAQKSEMNQYIMNHPRPSRY